LKKTKNSIDDERSKERALETPRYRTRVAKKLNFKIHLKVRFDLDQQEGEYLISKMKPSKKNWVVFNESREFEEMRARSKTQKWDENTKIILRKYFKMQSVELAAP
jgi:hypothetical protein